MNPSPQDLVQAFQTDGLIDLLPDDGSDNHPEGGADWGPDRQLAVDVIARLASGQDPSAPRPRVLKVRGARIVGDLDLQAATLHCSLILERCHLEGGCPEFRGTSVAVR